MAPQKQATKLKHVAPAPIQLTEGVSSHDHVTDASHITDVMVGEWHLISGDGLSGLYVVWSIRVVIDNALHSLILLYKRYSDIEKLRNALTKAYKDDVFPVLPPKDTFSLLRAWQLESWLEHRRKGLQWFLTNTLLNPKYQHDPIITDFVLK
ncbi:Phox-like protein [Metschnikowia bicuspidata var. bicuspidata NRRL YB-4993]|uniref:Endosomal/vacuolar adapter protein YPT35 n=1 Tax=Metschnikowia bicuspidata var. bicuspidata NRRL YB-4993 TaxID=869754 RepID=A0A1A0HKK0_9ASCO|nr:Phox-like protein [Metschnikowia bicuspidata var. bicuspidata NRRL YB-4993]OBA24516.1 Phox-like protein [Metschnikowia bicuspidata var. bicuspidata NRRL YB-4993]